MVLLPRPAIRVARMSQSRSAWPREAHAPPHVLKLPPEILSEIFLVLCANNASNDLTARRTPIPSVISFVCQLWRDVVVNLPTVWSNITFNTQQNSISRLADILTLYLGRSRNMPLSIHGTLSSDGRDIPAFLALLTHAHHWHTIHIEFDHTLIPTLNLSIRHVPLLEHLSLSIIHPHPAPRWLDIDKDITAFMKAPRLRTAVMCPLSLRHALLPSDQIHRITVRREDFLFTLMLLDHSFTSLTHLVLRGWNDPSFSASVRLPHLRTLCIIQDHTSSSAALKHVFAHLDAPELAALHVEGSHGISIDPLQWDLQAFKRMVQRYTPCPLTMLSLSRVAVSEDDLVSSLELLPFIETLTIIEGPRLVLSDAFIAALIRPSIFLRRLYTLDLKGRLRFSPRCVAKMYKSRVEHQSQSKGMTGLRHLGLTLALGGEMLGLVMSRVLEFDAELPHGVSLDVEERAEVACDHCDI
ncbi:hypothetical protein H0H92_009004 [Tricholoma furcatifolium]|nr:hypothetical protein H0H92_009004 [Tricholoma furcatifolium]